MGIQHLFARLATIALDAPVVYAPDALTYRDL